MYFQNLVTLGLLAVSVSAKGDGMKHNSTNVNAECSSMAQLTKMTELASNDTKLAQLFHNNQTSIDAFKSKVASETTKLSALSSNATLMSQCATIEAHHAAVRACGMMKEMEREVATAANQTKLDKEFKGNATKIAAFQSRASAAATKLSTMQSNSTLTSFCAVQTEKDTCTTMARLQKEVDRASNQTALNADFKGNATRIDRFKAEVAEVQTKLDAMKSNATLVSACSSLAKAGGTENDAAPAASGTSGAATTTSDAVRFGAMGGSALATIAGLVAMFSVLLL